MSRWQFEFLAKRPSSPDEQWNVGVQEKLVRLLLEKGDKARLARLILVKETFDNSLKIYRGWSRPDTDDCFVYVGKPDHDYRSGQIETPAPPDMFFLVFVLPDGTIDFWDWRPADADDPQVPQGVKGEVLWSLA